MRVRLSPKIKIASNEAVIEPTTGPIIEGVITEPPILVARKKEITPIPSEIPPKTAKKTPFDFVTI